MNIEKLGLNLEQTEILYNLQYYKVLNDVENTESLMNKQSTIALKNEWLREWQQSLSQGFPSFIQKDDAKLKWYTKEELLLRIAHLNPNKIWLRLVTLEAMLFTPYYPLSLEPNKNGNFTPSKKYKEINTPFSNYNKDKGYKFLEMLLENKYLSDGYIQRLRKSYNKATNELKEVTKTVLKAVSVTLGITVLTVFTAGAFAPAIAVALVGSEFAGLSGAALTSACLAYLGGGAIAAGGFGMAGGTIAIVGGGAALGLGVGGSVAGTVGTYKLQGKNNLIINSAKLIVTTREILLNDDHDIEFSKEVLKQCTKSAKELSNNIVELEIEFSSSTGKDKKELKKNIKELKELQSIMSLTCKNLSRFISSFEIGHNM